METARFFLFLKKSKPHKTVEFCRDERQASHLLKHTMKILQLWVENEGWNCFLYHLYFKVVFVSHIYLYYLHIRIQFLISMSFAWLLGSWAAEHKTKELQGSFDRWTLHSARHCDTAGKLFSLYVSYYTAFFQRMKCCYVHCYRRNLE